MHHNRPDPLAAPRAFGMALLAAPLSWLILAAPLSLIACSGEAQAPECGKAIGIPCEFVSDIPHGDRTPKPVVRSRPMATLAQEPSFELNGPRVIARWQQAGPTDILREVEAARRVCQVAAKRLKALGYSLYVDSEVGRFTGGNTDPCPTGKLSATKHETIEVEPGK